MSHWEAITVTHAFKRAENAGKGLENITAKLAGSQEGNNDFNTRLLRRDIGMAWEARETNTFSYYAGACSALSATHRSTEKNVSKYVCKLE